LLQLDCPPAAVVAPRANDACTVNRIPLTSSLTASFSTGSPATVSTVAVGDSVPVAGT